MKSLDSQLLSIVPTHGASPAPKELAELSVLPGLRVAESSILAYSLGMTGRASRRAMQMARASLAAIVITILLLQADIIGQEPGKLTAVESERLRQEVVSLLASHLRTTSTSTWESHLSHLAKDATIFGTDPSERFDRAGYEVWAKPYFEAGRGRQYKPLDQSVFVEKGGRWAWFDMRVLRGRIGELRITGVLRRVIDRWQFVQLNHAFPVPEAIVPDLVKKIRATGVSEPVAERAARTSGNPAMREIKALLTTYHAAAVGARIDAHVACLSENSVVLGPHATERFSLPAYKKIAKLHFGRGSGWKSNVVEQNVHIAQGGSFSWFEERIVDPRMGELRATGAIRRENGEWRIVQFNMTLPMPNAVVGDFLKMRGAALGGRRSSGKLSPSNMRDDLDHLHGELQSRHPALYAHASKEEFDGSFEEAGSSAQDDLTTSQFEGVIASVLARIRCANTRIAQTPEQRSDQRRFGAFLPLHLEVFDGRLYVIYNYGEADTLRPGDEVLAIDDEQASHIVARLLGTISSDGGIATHKLRVLNDRFAELYHTFFGGFERFTLRYRPSSGSSVRLVRLASVSFADRQWARIVQNPVPAAGLMPTFEFLRREDTAVLTLNSFCSPPAAGFSGRIDHFFGRVKAEGLGNLILDLRHNGGGDPENGAHLFSYLAVDRFTYLELESGGLESRLHALMSPAKNRLRGQLYVLIGGRSTSTTGNFCWLVKQQDRGTFIGEDSGSAFTFNGDASLLTLPNSEIRVSIPRTVFRTPAEGLPRGKGLMPDHVVKPTLANRIGGVDAEMALARRLIQGNR